MSSEAGEVAAPSAAHSATPTVGLRVTGLKVDNRERFLGLGNPTPRLSWRTESPERNVTQHAYRILVASSQEVLRRGSGDLWDSGKILSEKSLDIPYGGAPLASRQRCWWTVEIWDASCNRARSDGTDWWEMGLLALTDWSAMWLAVEDRTAHEDRKAGLKWIWGHAPADVPAHGFRLNFDLTEAASGGELIVALSHSYWWNQIARIWLDGHAIAGPGKWLAPFPPEFDASQFDDSHDATVSKLVSRRVSLSALPPGRHVLAIEVCTRPVGPWSFALLGTPANKPGLASLCRLRLDSGAIMRFTTGPEWRTHSTTLGGDVKTRLTLAEGWYQPDFDDSAWTRAVPNSDESHQPWPARPAMLLRRTFSTAARVIRARLYVTALGTYEARLNGVRIGDHVLAPGPAQYDKRVPYQVFAVESLVRIGNNALTLTVADGWYANFDGRFAWEGPPRRAIAQLELVYEDGTHELVTTGSGWRIADSSIISSRLKVGEVHDNSLEPLGWDCAEFDDSLWPEAHTAQWAAGELTAQSTPPIQIKRRLKPVAITETGDGRHIIDFGMSFAGWCEIRVRGSKGARIELRYSELVDESYVIDQSRSFGDPTGEPQVDVFFLAGDQAGELLAPRFVYRGFRYVQVSGLSAALHPDAVEGILIHSDLEETAALRTDNPVIQGTFRIALQAQRSVCIGVAVDNCTRELRGYMMDMGVFGEAAAYLMDVSTFFPNHVQMAVDARSEDGIFALYAPCGRHAKLFPQPPGDSPGWGLSVFYMVWYCWRQYGDTAVIARNWEAMNRYMQFIAAHNPTYLWLDKRGFDFGDWLSLEATPKDLFGTAFWAHAAAMLAQMSRAVQRGDEADRLDDLRSKILRAFNAAFVQPDGRIGNGSQTSYALPLVFDLLTQEMRVKAGDRLARAVRTSSPFGLSTGTWGTRFILHALMDCGQSELVYELLTKTSYPSWGYMLRNGATAMWEHWDGKAGSHSQPALGSVAGFLLQRVAGINAASPGFTSIAIRPQFTRFLAQGGGDYNSVMGRISTDWSRSANGDLRLETTIPANAHAHVHLPVNHASRIFEGGRELDRCSEIRLVRRTDDAAVIAVGSGDYRFVVAG